MTYRVLVVAPGYPPMVGGGEVYASSVARELVAGGLDVRVLTSAARETADFWRGAGPSRDEDGASPVRRLSLGAMTFGRWGLGAWRGAMVALSALPGNRIGMLSGMSQRVPDMLGLRDALAQNEGCRIVHAFNMSWECGVVGSARFALANHVPLVITPFMHLGRGLHTRVARNTTMQHQIAVLKQASAVLALGEGERRSLIALGVSPERAHCVGAGFAPGGAGERADVRRTLLRYGIRQPYVLMLGRVSADKGAMRAIRAVTALRSSRLQIGLVLAGEVSPEMRRTLARASHRLGDSVTVLGRVSEEHKWGLLKGAVALLLPSEVESFGLVILEAWACGKPVIGCRAGGLPDLIRHGETGLLVDIDDAPGLAAAIRGLVESPATAAVLGEAGEKQVCEYTWTAVAARIRAVYDQVLQEAPR